MTTPCIDGLDIHDVYQPVTDWQAATSYRLMTCKVSEGRSVRTGGLAYFRKFREHNVEFRGVYHWLRSDSPMETQAGTILRAIDQLGGLQDGEFVQADWETTPNIPLVTSDQCWEWCQRVEERWPGRVIVYSSDWLPDSTLDADSRGEFDEWFEAHPTYPLWFANYNTGTSKSSGWVECERYGADIWQWSSTQMVPGIATRVDVNHVFDWATLERIAHVVPDVVVEPPVVVKPPKPALPSDPPGGDLMITVFQPADCDAEFIGMTDKNGNALELEWIETAEDQRRRDAHIAAGARIDRGAATKGRFRNCNVNKVPQGDSRYVWSAADFHAVR